MRIREAFENLDLLYDSTFDEAVAFIVYETGKTEIAEEILTKTYYSMLEYFLKTNEFEPSDIQVMFLDTLKKNLSGFVQNESCANVPKAHNDISISLLNDLIDTDFEISEKEFKKVKLSKKIYKFISDKPSYIRKIFLLYFHCGYTIKTIAITLKLSEEDVISSLYSLLGEIKEKFLKYNNRH